jgi:hypothetical protein
MPGQSVFAGRESVERAARTFARVSRGSSESSASARYRLPTSLSLDELTAFAVEREGQDRVRVGRLASGGAVVLSDSIAELRIRSSRPVGLVEARRVLKPLLIDVEY